MTFVRNRKNSSSLLRAVRIITFLLGASCLSSAVILALSLDTHVRVPVARTSTMVIAALLAACAVALFAVAIRQGRRAPGLGSAAVVVASAFVNAAALGGSVQVPQQHLLSLGSAVVGLILGTWFVMIAVERGGDKSARSVLE